jgi:DNA-binding response OmpR family regulator
LREAPRGTRLLVVEDEATLGRAMLRLLRQRGHDVTLASSCAEARRSPGTFSLGIFDIDLTDGDGVDLAVELTNLATVLRAVFFSGTRDDRQRARAARLGPFVDKALGVAELESAVTLALAADPSKPGGD